MSDLLSVEQQALLERLVKRLWAEARRIVPPDRLDGLKVASLFWSRLTDPANGLPGLQGSWRNSRQETIGQVLFNTDGSFFAEFDLCVPHPGKPAWFVEAVTAWGRDDQIKSEIRLLPMP